MSRRVRRNRPLGARKPRASNRPIGRQPQGATVVTTRTGHRSTPRTARTAARSGSKVCSARMRARDGNGGTLLLECRRAAFWGGEKRPSGERSSRDWRITRRHNGATDPESALPCPRVPRGCLSPRRLPCITRGKAAQSRQAQGTRGRRRIHTGRRRSAFRRPEKIDRGHERTRPTWRTTGRQRSNTTAEETMHRARETRAVNTQGWRWRRLRHAASAFSKDEPCSISIPTDAIGAAVGSTRSVSAAASARPSTRIRQ